MPQAAGGASDVKQCCDSVGCTLYTLANKSNTRYRHATTAKSMKLLFPTGFVCTAVSPLFCSHSEKTGWPNGLFSKHQIGASQMMWAFLCLQQLLDLYYSMSLDHGISGFLTMSENVPAPGLRLGKWQTTQAKDNPYCQPSGKPVRELWRWLAI